MRLVAEHDHVPESEDRRGDLLSLDCSGLGKLVQIESLALMGMHFEELAVASQNVDADSDSADQDISTVGNGFDGLESGDAA